MSTWPGSNADYNVRQFRLMLRVLGEYLESGRRVADRGRLVAALDALGSALESPDRQWLTKFEDELLTLESVYAVSLDRGETLSSDADARLVNQATDRLLCSAALPAEQ